MITDRLEGMRSDFYVGAARPQRFQLLLRNLEGQDAKNKPKHLSTSACFLFNGVKLPVARGFQSCLPQKRMAIQDIGRSNIARWANLNDYSH